VRALAKVLRRLLPGIEEPEVRRATEPVISLAEIALGLKVSVQQAGRNGWYRRVAPAAPCKVPDVPANAVHHPVLAPTRH
jgi:hypothetical protein